MKKVQVRTRSLQMYTELALIKAGAKKDNKTFARRTIIMTIGTLS